MSVTKMITPIILPSGITVDANVAEKLIAKNRNDPFDPSIKVKSKIIIRGLFNNNKI